MKNIISHIDPSPLNGELASKSIFFPVPEKLDAYVYPFLHGTIDQLHIKDFASYPIPTGYLVMFIHFGSEIELYDHHYKHPVSHSCFVTGVHTLNKRTYLHASKAIDNLVITFKPGGFSRIFNHSAFELRNRVIDLNELVTPEVMKRIHELTQTAAIEERLTRLSNLLIFMLEKSTFTTRKNHIEVLDLIHQNSGNISLNDICNRMNLTPRTIERSFQINVGISPKEYIRIVRFNSIFKFLLNNRFEDWQDVVHRFGYYDQPHFIHDFKAVTGLTPGQFVTFSEHGIVYLDRFQIVYQVENLRHRKL